MRKKNDPRPCAKWDETDLAEYHDNVMAGPRKKLFEEHMLKCKPCREAYRGLLNDLSVLDRPPSVFEKIRSLFRSFSYAGTVVVRLLEDGLKLASGSPSNPIVPEFAPAVRGGEKSRLRAFTVRFSSASESGTVTVRARDRATALLGCGFTRRRSAPMRLSLSRNGKILEEKINNNRKKSSVEFLPVEKGTYEIRSDGKKIIRLKIV